MLALIPPPPGSALDLGPLSLRYYGLAVALGVLAAVLLTRRRYRALGGNPDDVDLVAVGAVVAGFLGARLGFVIWRLDQFADRPLAALALWEGGLVLFGGLLVGLPVGYLLARRRRLDIPAFADAVAPAIPLGQAIGRWGNYFNQELYGRLTDVPWALRVRAADGSETLHHPTFLYESVANLLLVAVLLLLDRTGKIARGGLLFAYLAGYGLIRFSIELLRIDTDFRLLGLSRNNWAFLALTVAGLVGLAWWQRRSAGSRTQRRR